MIENWRIAEVHLGEYEIVIIQDDVNFDNKMRGFYKSGLKAIVDPILNSNGDFIKGIIIDNMNHLMGGND